MKTLPNSLNVSLTQNADTMILPQNERRVAIVFSPTVVGVAAVTNGQVGKLDTGIRLFTGGSPILLSERDIGDAIQQEWHAYTTSAAASIALIEYVRL